jgi:CheY-like chemotaxis protein
LVSLSDTGVGMDAETVSRAFEPFFTTKPTGKGTGLGLSQVYGFATSSQGFVRIDSAPGDGTTVKLYLPRVDGDVAAAVAPDPDESAPLVAGGEVVLIVEDDPGVREMAIESLIELGYGILTAASGPEALEVIRGGARIDILFSDIVMPGGMNGVELSVEAHRIRPDIRILLTSGYAAGALTGDDVPEGLNVIAKPYRLEDLSQKLQQVLSG